MSFLVKRSTLQRTIVFGCVGFIAALAGCAPGSIPNISPPQIADTADYTIDNVRIFAPPAGDLGNGTVQVIVEFTLNADTGSVSPIVWVWEHDVGDNFPPQPGSSGDLGNDNPHEGGISLTASGQDTLQTSFTFTCGGSDGDEVIGPNGGGTGEGD